MTMRQEEAKFRSLGYMKQPPTEEVRAPQRPIEEITCFKCGTKGHYANKCPKGHLAFLSNQINRIPHVKDKQDQKSPNKPYNQNVKKDDEPSPQQD